MNGMVHLLIGSLGLAFALLVLRADPRRWDNRAFAMLGTLDALMALYRGVAATHGVDIADRSVMWPCAVLAPTLAWWSIEFVYSFPFGRKLPWRWRLPLLAWTGAAMVVIAVLAGSKSGSGAANIGYFIPATIVVIVLAVRNLRRHTGDRFGVRMVFAALMLRWVTANIVYSLYGSIDAELWSDLLWIESTVVVLLAFVLISFANIRSNLFTMRSAMGELALESAFVLSGLILTAVAVDGAQRIGDSWPRVERAMLMLATLVPLFVYVVAERLRPRLEASVDPRRALRREVLERSFRPGDEHTEPAAAIGAATAALAEISGGGKARFVPATDFPVELAAMLAQGGDEPFRSDAFGEQGELVAPVRRGGRLDGALVLRGGVHDRESTQAASFLSAQLGMAFEHRRLVGELEESRRLAALGSFAAAIAHDIRTPLTSVQMNVQILRAKSSLPADDMEYFDIALDELRRLEGHVKELLDYAKPLQLHRETIEIRDLTEDAARVALPILHERKQRFVCEHAEDVPPVTVDPQRMKQVLWNLLENAAKASPEGATIAVHTRKDGGRVAIDVVDHGAGIAAADLQRIFEPFFTTRPDGTGLGLAICQKVVKAHAGEIRVQSELAQGSTFTVLLPA